MVSRSQKLTQAAPSSSTPQQGRKRKRTRERRPFHMPPAVPVSSEGVPGNSPPDRVPHLLRVGAVCQRTGGACRLMGQSPGCCPSCGMGVASCSWTLLIPSLIPIYRFRRIDQDLCDCWFGAGRLRRCWSRIPWKSPSIRVPASTVVLFLWKRRRGWLPMIDLSDLNEFVLQTPFKMETLPSGRWISQSPSS